MRMRRFVVLLFCFGIFAPADLVLAQSTVLSDAARAAADRISA
jgi:hypothetical protein